MQEAQMDQIIEMLSERVAARLYAAGIFGPPCGCDGSITTAPIHIDAGVGDLIVPPVQPATPRRARKAPR